MRRRGCRGPPIALAPIPTRLLWDRNAVERVFKELKRLTEAFAAPNQTRFRKPQKHSYKHSPPTSLSLSEQCLDGYKSFQNVLRTLPG